MRMILKQIATQSSATSPTYLHPEEEHDWQLTSGRPISGQEAVRSTPLSKSSKSLAEKKSKPGVKSASNKDVSGSEQQAEM